MCVILDVQNTKIPIGLVFFLKVNSSALTNLPNLSQKSNLHTMDQKQLKKEIIIIL